MKRCAIGLLLLLFLTGCGQQPEASETPRPPLYDQALLFLQQGLRQHGITDTFQVYFAQPEEQGLELLLEDESGFWWESLTYAYDSERDWYTFTGSSEPVLTGDSFVRKDLDQTECLDFRAAAVYRTELSGEMDLEAPLRFDVPAGPVVYRQRREDADWANSPETWIYVYQDQRLSFTAQFEYPQYSVYISGLSDPETVNQRIWDALSYGYPYGADRAWNPSELAYGEVFRNCLVTRADRRYFSARIYEFNSFRGANHPNEWESGVTVDLETGRALTLRDVIGPDRTVEELLDSGAFHCLSIWAEGQATPEIRAEADAQQIQAAKNNVDPESPGQFYLTEDSLGLISAMGRYYYCMEAPLASLGLEAWAAGA